MFSQFRLLNTRRFAPLFIVQFFGALNDNIFKNALAIFVTYEVAKNSSSDVQELVTWIAFIFILPFFLFSAWAGQLADKYDKGKITRIVKFIEIILMITAFYAFKIQNLFLLMSVLFGMGTHSTFFGPVKYGILPQLLHKNELLAGNGLVSSSTFIAILIGTIIGGLLIMTQGGVEKLGILVVASAFIGYVASWFIPKNHRGSHMKVKLNIIKQSLQITDYVKENPRLFWTIIAISWFWFIGITFLTQFPNFAKDVIRGNNEIVTLFLTVFSIGVAVGSLICNHLLKGKISTIYVPAATILLSLFTIDLYFASGAIHHYNHELMGLRQYLKDWQNIRILVDLAGISISGGIYIVPLYAMLQAESHDTFRSRIIAALNIISSGFMVMSAIFTILLFKLEFSVPQVFLSVALLNFLVAVFIRKLLPK